MVDISLAIRQLSLSIKWEDDGTTTNKHSSVNRGSITEYRAKLDDEPSFYYRSRWLG